MEDAKKFQNFFQNFLIFQDAIPGLNPIPGLSRTFQDQWPACIRHKINYKMNEIELEKKTPNKPLDLVLAMLNLKIEE